ncbi:hypothetical protein B7494_g6368 [Chlorociboria aeruginascens]|nr:hypothetical protein B7494_g6368 [Chlorociboria aeruginascens]
MRFSGETSWRSLLLSTLLCTNAWAKRDGPSVKITPFQNVPFDLQYFEDSDVVMFLDPGDRVAHISRDAGETWDKVKGVPEGKVWDLSLHPFDSNRAYIITTEKTHWRTKDRGKTWDEFFTDAPATLFQEPLRFHAGDPDRIIFNGMDCTGLFCEELTMYTTNGFDKDAKFLRSDTVSCNWAKASALFTTGQEDLDKNRVLCVVKGRFSPWRADYRLVVSDNFFTSNDGDVQQFEPELEPGRTVQGIVNMAIVKKYLVVAATAKGTDEMALYVSDDAIKWHRAEFPHDHKLTESAYTILESTNYSIQIDVMTTRPGNPMGVFFSSNSNGTYFTRNVEHTNRRTNGLVDFEKIAGIQGIVLVNVVDNWEAVEKSFTQKNVRSQISFDDGRTWEGLKAGDKNLNLHSVTDMSNSGRVFSSPAPGLVMGNGNTGDFLKGYREADLFVSDDAGATWQLALEGAHKYEFGDQGSILVAIKEGMTDELMYSLNHGKDWSPVDLGKKLCPALLTTTQDSTSLKFILLGADTCNIDDVKEGYVVAVDFDDMHEAQCKNNDNDMETWYARVDEESQPTCLMGHKQSYRRRKADADCFLKKEFQDPEVISEQCECTKADFECDYNFIRSDDRQECIQAGKLAIPEDACKSSEPGEKFLGSSGWRLIPGNDCKRTSGKQQDDPIERECAGPASGAISHVQKTFKGIQFTNKVYLERTGISTGDDETVILQTNERKVWLTHDHGKTWEQILEDENILHIYANPYFNDAVYFLTDSKTIFYSVDRGDNIRNFEVKLEPMYNYEDMGLPWGQPMSFHPKNKDWIIWTGAKDCVKAETCHLVASITEDRGDDWKTLQRYVKKCEFIKELGSGTLLEDSEKDKDDDRDKLIYCEVKEHENNNQDNPWQLVSSENFFNKPREVHFPNIVDFATMSEFIVVATKDEEHQTLKVDASVDGKTFADAQFPHGFNVDHQQGYTVLDSSTHSVFLHVTVNNERGLEYGTIIKSNSNGTSYVLSIDAVDRDTAGYVDFEKMFGIEGVAMVNVVANYQSDKFRTEGKKLKTMITHNDGAEWDYLKPPAKDADGKNFGCKGSADKCSLNIHGYTERADKTHTFSSRSAIGLMIGVGNVGEYLTAYKDADTFMTSDGGLTWKPVKKGPYMWEFGDQGSIVVVVKEEEPTNEVYYSLDEGDSWLPYKFSEREIVIDDITTVPSDNSRNFLLWGYDGDVLLTINLDFTGLTNRQCELDEGDVEGGDYYLWQPKHPKQSDDCLFGHVSQYHRKRTDSACYNGRMIPHLHDVARNCSCTRQDFECDYNYERQSDGSCGLVPGLEAKDAAEVCKLNPDLVEYFDAVGYRRIPLTTCQGGREMDLVGEAHPCPGHEEQFKKKHRASAAGIFFAVTIPIIVAIGVGYYVWKNWAGNFGQIRLGEQSPFDGDAPWIKYPVLVVAAIVAVAQALPLLAASLWRSASNIIGRGTNRRFTTRDSFARGRGDYAVVDEDEGELLGDDSDEDTRASPLEGFTWQMIRLKSLDPLFDDIETRSTGGHARTGLGSRFSGRSLLIVQRDVIQFNDELGFAWRKRLGDAGNKKVRYSCLVFMKTSVAEGGLDPRGWTPKPTPAPRNQIFGMMKRDDEYPTAIIAPNSICGYFSGSADLGYDCPASNTCVFYPATAGYGNVACCNDNDPTCNIRVTCIDSSTFSSACGSSCQSDDMTRKCTNSAAPFCGSIRFLHQSVQDFFCDSTKVTTWQTGYTAFGGQTDDREFSTYISPDASSSTTQSSKSSTGSTAKSSSSTSSTSETSKSAPTNTDASTAASLTSSSTNAGAAADPTDGTGAVNGTTPTGSQKSSSNTGAIAGGVIGGILGITLVASAIWYLLRNRKMKTAAPGALAEAIEGTYEHDNKGPDYDVRPTFGSFPLPKYQPVPVLAEAEGSPVLVSAPPSEVPGSPVSHLTPGTGARGSTTPAGLMSGARSSGEGSRECDSAVASDVTANGYAPVVHEMYGSERFS